MKEIILTNKALITKIAANETTTIVDLEWGGPHDKLVHDFDLASLGKISASGTNGNAGRSGWVVLDGPCLLKEGDTIPLTEGA